jgi:hypothetical protein
MAETEGQILFRKYGEHIRDCSICSASPRCEQTMCDLGRAILISYREHLEKHKEVPVANPRNQLAQMTWDQLAQTLKVLENKPTQTPEDRVMMNFIDSLIKEKVEYIWALSEVYWEEHRQEGK